MDGRTVTTLSLGHDGVLALLVLGDLVLGVFAALLAFAVRAAGLGDVDHDGRGVMVVRDGWARGAKG